MEINNNQRIFPHVTTADLVRKMQIEDCERSIGHPKVILRLFGSFFPSPRLTRPRRTQQRKWLFLFFSLRMRLNVRLRFKSIEIHLNLPLDVCRCNELEERSNSFFLSPRRNASIIRGQVNMHTASALIRSPCFVDSGEDDLFEIFFSLFYCRARVT